MSIAALFLALPLIVLGAPLTLGAWCTAVKIHSFLKKRTPAATTITVCIIAATFFILTAPFFVLGTLGYLLTLAVFVFYIAIGMPHTIRVLKFLKLELDDDPTNDVPLPGAK